MEGLIVHLATHQNTEEHFYTQRALVLSGLSAITRASRFIFLNKTCFNGLYRENKSGQFNSPFGRYVNPTIVDAANLRAVSTYLRYAHIDIIHSGYEHVLDKARAGDLVYFDPPYVPLTASASFVSYTKAGFGMKDQQALANAFRELDRRGVRLMLSNSNTEIVHSLYKPFRIQVIHATRAINSKGTGRARAANEVLVTNY